MAKGHADETDRRLDNVMNRANTQYNDFNQRSTERSVDAWNRQRAAYDTAMQGFTDLSSGAWGSTVGGNGPGGGGAVAPTFTMPDYSKVSPTYTEFMNTGGIDPSKMRVGNKTLEELMHSGGFSEADNSTINRSIAGFEAMQANGGVDEASRARFRGNGVFDEFSRTGGMSGEDIRNIRSRATSTIPSFYGGLNNEMARQRRIGGGSTAMGNAGALRLARQGSRDSAEAALNAELGISDRLREGRQWGATGASTSEAALQSLVTGNQLAALRGSSDLALGRSKAMGDVQLRSAGMLGDVEKNIQDYTQRGRMWGTEGTRGMEETLAQIRNQQASASASAASSNNASDERRREFDLQMRMAGLQGIAGLRGQTPGEDAFYSGQVLAGIGGQTGANLSGIGLRYGSPNASGSRGSTIGGIAGSVLGSYLSSGGSFGFGNLGRFGFGGGREGDEVGYNPPENVEDWTRTAH